jgi:hypothetical protein
MTKQHGYFEKHEPRQAGKQRAMNWHRESHFENLALAFRMISRRACLILCLFVCDMTLVCLGGRADYHS